MCSNANFETRTEFFLVGMKVQLDGGGGRILLGDNSWRGRSCCSRSVFIKLEVWFQLGFRLYAYTADCIYSIATYTGSSGSYLSGTVCYC